MGTLVGHVAPGFGFLLIGLWHLLNHIRLHALNPNTYKSQPWFPTPRIKYLELYLIIGGSLASISMELFIGPEKHQPFDSDLTIPSNHLHNFEHSNISISFLVYSIFCIILDHSKYPAKYVLTQLLASLAFGQQLLIFHLHSSDHMGIEGQYHWLLQIVIFVSLITTLLGIPFPNSFINSFVRSYSILLQGVWFMVMGFMLWTPHLIPKGCFINAEEGHHVVRCHDHDALERAKSLVNIEFSWYVIGVTIFSVAIYIFIVRFYDGKAGYRSLATKFEEQDYQSVFVIEDVEAQKAEKIRQKNIEEPSKRFLEIGKLFVSSDIER